MQFDERKVKFVKMNGNIVGTYYDVTAHMNNLPSYVRSVEVEMTSHNLEDAKKEFDKMIRTEHLCCRTNGQLDADDTEVVITFQDGAKIVASNSQWGSIRFVPAHKERESDGLAFFKKAVQILSDVFSGQPIDYKNVEVLEDELRRSGGLPKNFSCLGVKFLKEEDPFSFDYMETNDESCGRYYAEYDNGFSAPYRILAWNGPAYVLLEIVQEWRKSIKTKMVD